MNRCFFDSNILLYAFKADDSKQLRAERLMHEGGAISVQCLNEVAAVAKRKLGMTWERIFEARDIIADLCSPVLPLTIDLHRLGLRIAEEYRLAIYDGMIVAAALTANCDILWSEDMHDGLVIDGRLRIVNPFAPVPDDHPPR